MENKTEPIELRLCEASRLGLRPNVVYIFTVDPTCPSCVRDNNMYGDELTPLLPVPEEFEKCQDLS